MTPVQEAINDYANFTVEEREALLAQHQVSVNALTELNKIAKYRELHRDLYSYDYDEPLFFDHSTFAAMLAVAGSSPKATIQLIGSGGDATFVYGSSTSMEAYFQTYKIKRCIITNPSRIKADVVKELCFHNFDLKTGTTSVYSPR